MLTQILLVLVVLVVALLAYAATRSSTLHVERSATVAAPPDAIASFITDFHLWQKWSPYEGRDPAMTRTFSGATAGKGAVYEWRGNNNVGEERMEITEIVPARITIKLDFLRPFEAHNIASFILQPAGGLTTVTWAMDGCNSYMSKVMGIFINMDNMIGKDFAVGLVNLKGIAEQ